MRKKIIALGHEASLSGAPKLFLELLKELKKQNFKIIVFLKTGGDLLSEFNKVGDVYLLDSINKKSNFFFKLIIRLLPVYKIRNAYLKFKFKNFKANLILNYTVVNGKLLPYVKDLKTPMITIAQEMKYVIKLFDLLKINNSKAVFNRTSFFIACSNSVKKDLVNEFNINKEKIKVIYNSVAYFNKKNAKNENVCLNSTFYVGMCGGPIHRKGPDLFLNTAKYVNENFKNESIKFIWQGGDENSSVYQDFLNEIELLNLNNTVEIIPNSKDVQPFFNKINMFFCSSREEPFGMVILEAGLNNLPVLAFQKTGGPEEILKDERGVLVPYGSCRIMAEKIVEVKNNTTLMLQLSHNLKAYSESNFNTNNNFEIIDQIKKIIS